MAWLFIWTNLSPRMLWTKLGWKWPSDKECYFQYTVQECQFLSELTTLLLTESTYIFIFSQFNFTIQRYKNLIISFIKKYFVQHLCKMLQNIPLYVQHVSVFARWCALTIYTSVHPVWTNQNHIFLETLQRKYWYCFAEKFLLDLSEHPNISMGKVLQGKYEENVKTVENIIIITKYTLILTLIPFRWKGIIVYFAYIFIFLDIYTFSDYLVNWYLTFFF